MSHLDLSLALAELDLVTEALTYQDECLANQRLEDLAIALSGNLSNQTNS